MSTFGIGEDLAVKQWRSIIRQLVARGYLESDPDGYGGLCFGPDAWALLRGEQSVRLRHDRKPQRKRSGREKAPSKTTYSGLRFTTDTSMLRRSEQSVRLRLERESLHKRSGRENASTEIAPADAGLWEALRETRKRLADEQGVPAFVIFSDATLREMLAHRPATKADFLALNGVGEKKLASYGAVFLRVIQNHAG